MPDNIVILMKRYNVPMVRIWSIRYMKYEDRMREFYVIRLFGRQQKNKVGRPLFNIDGTRIDDLTPKTNSTFPLLFLWVKAHSFEYQWLVLWLNNIVIILFYLWTQQYNQKCIECKIKMQSISWLEQQWQWLEYLELKLSWVC